MIKFLFLFSILNLISIVSFPQENSCGNFELLNREYINVYRTNSIKAKEILIEQRKILKKSLTVNPKEEELLFKNYYNYSLNLANYYRENNNIDSSIFYLKKSISFFRKINHQLYLIKSYNIITDYFQEANKVDSAFLYINKSKNYYLYRNDTIGLLSSNFKIASLYSDLGYYDSSLFIINNSIKIADSIKYSKELSNLHRLAGVVNIYKGNYDKSLNHFYSALFLNEKMGTWKNKLVLLEGIAGVYIYQNDWEMALNHYCQAKELAEQNNSLLDVADNSTYIASIYSQLNNHDSSFYYFNNAIDIYKLTKNNDKISFCYSNLAVHFIQVKNFKKGITFCEKALELKQNTASERELSELYFNLAACYYGEKEYNRAKTNFNLALKLTNDINLKKEILEQLYATLYFSKNYKEAIETQQEVINIMDSLEAIKLNKNIKELTIKYKTKIKENQNLELRNELAKNKKLKYLTNTIFFLIVVLFSIIFIYVINNKKKKIEIKNLIIANQKLENTELLEKLNHFKTRIVENNKIINTLKSELQSDSNLDRLIDKITLSNDWANFMNQFDLIHNNILSKLKNIHPNISNNDLRIISLIKLNLSNKEIAEILNITTDSVKTAKKRLKKKLNISKNLSSYIGGII